MPRETFTERFNRLTSDMKDSEIGTILGLTFGGVRKIKEGQTQSLKLDAALRLCARVGVSPWYLAGQMEPSAMQPVDHPPGPEEEFRELQREVRDLNRRLAPLFEAAGQVAEPQTGTRRRKA